MNRLFSNKKIKWMATMLLKTYDVFLDREEKGMNTDNSNDENRVNVESISVDQGIPEILLESIRKYYPNGLRFDDTVLRLIEEYSGCEIDKRLQRELHKIMFERQDGLCFLPDMVINAEQRSLIQSDVIIEMLDKYGCIVVNVLYKNYIANGDTAILRDEDDLENYLIFLMPNDIRISNVLNTKVIRRNGVTLNDAMGKTTRLIVKTISENGCMAQEDILNTYPIFSETFLRKLLENYADEIIVTKINDYLCYQTIESLGIDLDFSNNIHDVLGEIRRLSLKPTQDIIHALLSVKLGYNVREELGILDDKTFRHIISMFYIDERQRTWKAGSFVEAGTDYV